MIVLGIDPGLADTGWAILTKDKKINLIDYGCLKTNKNTDLSLRLEEIYQKILILVKKYHPDVLAIEDLFFAKNVKSAIKVAQVMGVIKLASRVSKISVAEYTPLNIKTTITGYGRAEKSQIERMINQLLSIKKKIEPDHAADAVATALTHLQTNSILKGN